MFLQRFHFSFSFSIISPDIPTNSALFLSSGFSITHLFEKFNSLENSQCVTWDRSNENRVWRCCKKASISIQAAPKGWNRSMSKCWDQEERLECEFKVHQLLTVQSVCGFGKYLTISTFVVFGGFATFDLFQARTRKVKSSCSTSQREKRVCNSFNTMSSVIWPWNTDIVRSDKPLVLQQQKLFGFAQFTRESIRNHFDNATAYQTPLNILGSLIRKIRSETMRDYIIESFRKFEQLTSKRMRW
jgi:hypothetical protein